MTTSPLPANPSNDSNRSYTCEFCPASFECGTLKMALLLLETSGADGLSAESAAAVEGYLKQIKSLGFDFPNATVPCSLATDRQQVAMLTNKITQILNERDHQRIKFRKPG